MCCFACAQVLYCESTTGTVNMILSPENVIQTNSNSQYYMYEHNYTGLDVQLFGNTFHFSYSAGVFCLVLWTVHVFLWQEFHLSFILYVMYIKSWNFIEFPKWVWIWIILLLLCIQNDFSARATSLCKWGVVLYCRPVLPSRFYCNTFDVLKHCMHPTAMKLMP